MRCECCNRREHPISVCSSGLGPVSFAICQECVINYAEPIEMIKYLFEYQSIDEIRKDILNYVTFFKDGKYHNLKLWMEQNENK